MASTYTHMDSPKDKNPNNRTIMIKSQQILVTCLNKSEFLRISLKSYWTLKVLNYLELNFIIFSISLIFRLSIFFMINDHLSLIMAHFAFPCRPHPPWRGCAPGGAPIDLIPPFGEPAPRVRRVIDFLRLQECAFLRCPWGVPSMPCLRGALAPTSASSPQVRRPRL